MAQKEFDMMTENPEQDQDRVKDTFDHFERFNYVMFPQSKKIYENLRDRIKWNMVLEAGCGIGTGAAIMMRDSEKVVATDKLLRNIAFGKELYPWINFEVWDIAKGPFQSHSQTKFSAVVCVEAIEHVKNYRLAIKNLIASAGKEVWISTPNGASAPEYPPSNPFHVREFTPKEMLEMIGDYRVEILHWETFEKLNVDTKVSPLVYHVIL